jgi:hypothetical protein
MPTTALTVQLGKSYWQTTGLAPNFQAMDAANGNHVESADMSDDMLIVARNTGAGARTITITSTPLSSFARTGDVAAESLAAGAIKIYRVKRDGWAQTDGKLLLSGSHAEMTVAVINLESQAG